MTTMSAPVPQYLVSRLIRMLPRKTISHFMGQVCDLPLSPMLSRALVHTYGRLYRVDMTEVVPRSSPYESFDAFFTRPLRPGARPISDEPQDVVSPADGNLQSVGRIEQGCRITVKRRDYDVARLVGDDQDARDLCGGQFAVVYLSPRDYHRVHAPVEGTISEVRGIAGDLYPVNSVGELCTRSLLVNNQRVAIAIDTESIGRVFVVMVGALIVGRITVCALPDRNVPTGTHRIEPSYEVKRGDEVGVFHLGSTAVVLAGPDATNWQRSNGAIRVGQSLVRFE